jgi:predicted nucleic acid-binding protein
MIAYVETSAVVKLVVDGPGAEVVADVWDRADEVVSSDILYAETCAALAAIRQAGGLDEAAYRHAVREAEDVAGRLRLVALDETIAAAAGDLAERHSLCGSAAIHLAAALSVDAPRIVITTWEPALSRAAADCGMPVVPGPSVQAAA